MSEMETDEIRPEDIYKPNDIVWVKISGMWWPAEVCDQKKLDPEVTEGLKKQPLAVVKFLQEDVYEFIRDFDLINHYYCKKKWDFLKLGFKKYRKLKNEANVALFPSSVQEAERRTGGDPNIINHPELAEEPAVTPKNKSISVKPTSTPITHSRETRPKKPVRTVHLPQPELVEKKGWSWYPYPKYIGHSFSPRKRNEPHHPPAYIHRCSLCAFETTQLEILVWHHKMDQHRWGHTGKWVNVGPPQITEAVESPKEDKKIVKKTKPKKKKQLPPPVGQSTPAPKKKKKDEPPAVLETSHLAEEISKEWGDEIEDEIGSHVDQDGDLSEIDTQKTIPVTLDHSESQNDEEPSRVTETAANKTSSCFDFDEEEPAEPTLQSLKFGQKLPRVITPEKSKPTKESMADSVTDDLELEGFLKDVAVPEIPNIPIAKLGSPTKETGFSRGDRSYGRSPFCDSPRRVEHQEEQSIQNSSEDGTSGKNEHSTNNKHFLAKGPLQSKRKSFGHTEGAEDGSVTKKRIESCGSHKPSSKCDDQSRASIKLKLFQPMPEEGSAALNSTAEDTSSPQAEDQATNKRQTRSGSGETQTPIIKSKGAGSEMRDNKVIRDDNGSSLRYSGNFACSNGEVIAANDEGLCEEGIKVSQLNNQDLKGIDTLQQLSGLTSVLHVKSPSVASTLPGDEVDDLILHVSSEEAFENERPREPILAESIVNSQQPLESESEVPRNVVDSTPKSSQSFARKSKRTSSSLVADKTQKNKLSLHEEVIETASGKSSIKTEMKVQSEVLAALSDTKVCEAGEDSKPEIRRSRRSSTKPTPEDTEVVNEKKGEKLLPEKTGKGKVKPSIDLTKNEVAKSSSVKRRRSVEERLADAMVDNGDRVESENKSRKTRKTSHSPERLRNKNESLSKKEEKPRRGRSDVKPLNEQSSPAPNIDSGAALSPLESDILLDTPRERVATFASDHIALRRERSSRSHKSPQRNVSSNKRPSSSSFEQKDKSKIGKSRNKDVSLLTSHPGDGANHVEKPLAVSDSSSSKHTRNSKSSKSPRTDVTPKSQPPVSTSCEAKLRRGRSDDAKTPDKSDHVNHSTSPVSSKSNKYSRREKERSTSIDDKPRRGRSDDHKSHDSSTPQLDTRSKFKKSIPGDSMAKKSEQPVSNVIDKPQSRVISEDRDISNRILIEPSTQQSTQQDEPSVVTSSSASELSLTNDGTPKKARSSKSSKSPMKENVAAAIIQPPSASIDGEHVHQKTPLEIHDSKPPMDINLLREDVNSKSKSPLNRQESKDRSLDHFEVPDSTPEIDSAVTLSSAEVRPGSTVETGLTDLQVELSAEMVPSNLLPEIKTPKKEKSDELEKLEACGEDGNTLIMNDTKPARWLDDKKTPVKENSKIPISNSMASTPTHALLTGGSDSLKDEKNNGMAQFETALTENFPEIPPPADNCAVDLHDSVVVEPSLRASSKVDNMSVEKSLDDPNVSDCTLTSAVQPAKPGGDQSGLTKTPVKIGPVRNDPQRGAAQPTPSKRDHAARGRIQSDPLENILAHSSPISPPGSSPNQKGASVSVKFPEELGNHEAISKQDAKKPVASPIKLVGESQVSSAIEPLNAIEAPGIASIKSSRWDSPFPVKKSEGRSTPLSPMRSPTKSPLSPVGKVKVEIKSGLGRACFKSPPRINLEDALSPKPPRIGSDAASPLEDEFSALQAEIQAYTSPAKEVDKVPEANFSEKKTALSLDCKSLSDIKDDLQSLEDVLKTPPVSRSLSPTKPADVVQSLPLECIPLPPDPPKSVVSAQQVPGLTETTLLLNDDVNGRSIKEEIVESSSASDASPSPTKKPPSTPKITPITVPPDTPASGPADVKVLSSQYVGNCQPSQCGFTDALNMELDISNMPVVFGDEEDLLFSETTAEESIEDSLIEEISEPQVKTTTKTAPCYVAPPNPWDGKLVIKEVEGPLVVESRKLSCVVFDVYPVGHPEFDYYMSLPGISPCPPDVRYPEASEEGSKVVDVDALEETNCQLPKVNVQPKVAVTPKVLQSSKLMSLGTKTVPMKQPINKAFLTGAPTAKMVGRSNVLSITNPVKITMDSKMVKASDMNAVGKQSSKLKIFSRSGKFHFEEVSPKKVDGGKATVMARQPTASSASISAVTSRARGRLSAPPAGRAALQIHAGRSIPHILTASKKTADKKISITRNASAKSGQKIQLLPKNQIKFVRTINSVPASSNMSILIEKKPPAAVPMVTPGSDILAQALLDTNLEPSDTMPTADIFVTTTPQPVIYAHLPTFINAGPSSAVSSTSESVKR